MLDLRLMGAPSGQALLAAPRAGNVGEGVVSAYGEVPLVSFYLFSLSAWNFAHVLEMTTFRWVC